MTFPISLDRRAFLAGGAALAAAADREHVIVLSDWSFMHPHTIFTRLKQEGALFNRQKRTLADKMSGKPEPATPADAKMVR